MWLEFILQKSTITDTTINFFAGLMECFASTTGIPISTADALVDKNQLGFFNCGSSTTGNGAIVRAVYKRAGQTAQMLTSGAVAAIDTTNVTTAALPLLTAATNFKLGLRFDRSDSNKNLRLYFNGVEQALYATNVNLAAVTFPNVKMAMMFGTMNSTGSTPPSVSLIRARCGQLF